MNPKKSGTVFIVLMIALLAFGVASAANVVGLGSNLVDSIVPTNLSLNGQQQVTAIGDASFTPVYVNKRAVVNVTNTTPVVVTNNSTNTSNNSG